MRDRILAVAGRLFAERGYAQTSVRDIAAELGIANPSLYHHFASKSELLGELLREPLERVHEAALAAAQLEGEARTRCLLEGLLEALEVHSGIALTALDVGGSAAGAQRALAEAALPDVAALLAGEVAGDPHDLRVIMTVGAVESAVRHLMRATAEPEAFVEALRARKHDIVDLAVLLLRG